MEATSTFDDPLAQALPDEDHSAEEFREILIGHSVRGRLLVVSFTEPVPDQSGTITTSSRVRSAGRSSLSIRWLVTHESIHLRVIRRPSGSRSSCER